MASEINEMIQLLASTFDEEKSMADAREDTVAFETAKVGVAAGHT